MAARLFCTLLLASTVALGEAVTTLTAASFDAFTKKDIALVKFYAPWCGHCKAMAPAYAEAAESLAEASPPVSLGKVDCTVEADICAKAGVDGYPALKIFKRGTASEYGGPRDAAGIIAHMVQQTGGTAPAIAPGISAASHQSPLLIAKLCQDQACNDPLHPVIDYDEAENKCHCSGHPCWDDNGLQHKCDPDGAHPHLSFSFDKDGKMSCGCRKDASYQSKYIYQVKCPGHYCDTDAAPILDYVPEEKKCICRAHPCSDMGGKKHSCDDPGFPVIHYREEVKDGNIKQVCECKAAIRRPNDEL